MTRTMKMVVAVSAAVLVFGTGFALAAARPWNQRASNQMMRGMSGSMMGGSTMMGGSMMMGGAGTGVNSAPAAIAGAREVAVTAKDLRFSPSTITVKTGEAVNVVFRNDDEIVHDFTVPALGIHVTAQPGQQVTFGLQPTTAGTFPFLCTVAGHAEAGMQGTIVVSS